MDTNEQLRRIAKLKKKLKELARNEVYRQEGDCLIIDLVKWKKLNDK